MVARILTLDMPGKIWGFTIVTMRFLRFGDLLGDHVVFCRTSATFGIAYFCVFPTVLCVPLYWEPGISRESTAIDVHVNARIVVIVRVCAGFGVQISRVHVLPPLRTDVAHVREENNSSDEEVSDFLDTSSFGC